MMLLGYVWFLSLAILGSAQEPWEINRSPSALEQDPNGVPDTRAATYFIDDSCLNEDEEDPDQMDVDENEPDFRDVMAEVQNMAREGFNRLKENLGDFRTGYIKIMKVSPENDIELKEQIVMRAFHRIGGMVEAASREAADIRIYCDNDISSVMGGDANSRWVPCPDELHPGGPYGDGRLNSGLDFEEQVFWDQVNTMYRRVSTHGVQDPDADGEETLAQTYRSRVDLVGSNENPNRETMTIGDEAFGDQETLGRIPGNNIVRSNIDLYEGLTSLTLFHELCHSHHILGVASTGPSEINGWTDVRDKPANIVRESADAFAFLGLYALMNSRNIRLHAGTDTLIPLHEFVDPLKAKRSHLCSSHQSKGGALSPKVCLISRTRAVPFVS